MNKVIIGVCILLGVVMTLSVCNIFSNSKPIQSAIATYTTVKELQQRSKKIIDDYKYRADSLTAHANIMKAALQRDERNLQLAKQQQLLLRNEVSRLIIQQKTLRTAKDTVGFYDNADTLTGTVTELITAADLQQEACEKVTTNLSVQLQNKDSVIVLKKEENTYLANTLNESFARQQQLEGQVKLLSKQVRRQKLLSKIRSAGLIALSTFTIRLLAK